jgi:alpha-2-macroglobulin
MSVSSMAARLARAFVMTAALGASVVIHAHAAERRAVVTEDADYFGRDIGTLKDITLGDCEKACIADEGCKAFTYNVKAAWCFMKADYGALRPFPGAVSGRIVEGPIADADLQLVRARELTFLYSGSFRDADLLLERISSEVAAGTLDEAMTTAARLAGSGELAGALNAYRQALRLAPERFDIWDAFVSVALAYTPTDWTERQRVGNEVLSGSILAYLRAVDDDQRARALDLISSAHVRTESWDRAIKAARMSLSLRPERAVAEKLDKLVAEHGFRVLNHIVDTESESPRICVRFSARIADSAPNIADYVIVTGGEKLPVEAEEQQICASGVEFGKRYAMTVRQGLPAADGEEMLHKSVTLDFYIRDRDPSVRFFGKAFVLPRHADATIPVASINIDEIEAQVVRIGDRNLTATVNGYEFLEQMGNWQTANIAQERGEAVWNGTITVQRETNREVTTAIPVGEVVETLKPGIYAMVASGKDDRDEWNAKATQWFVVTDIGITTLGGNDGLHAVLRSLGDAGPIVGATVTLVARNNEVLGTATTDDEGYARFDAGLIRGTGGNMPALITAMTAGGDYAFISLTGAAFDLTDRGVSGRPAPQPIDVFTTTERGVYRPGETVHVTTLMRDSAAEALPEVPMTLVIKRPDGAEHLRQLAADEGAGGRANSIELPAGAMRGSWRADVFTDPEAPALASTTFLVEDFLPERIDFTFDIGEEPLEPGTAREIEIKADWLYGAPAANRPVEGEVFVTRADGIPSAPTFRFGLEDEEFTPIAEAIDAPPTGEDGTTLVYLSVPDTGSVTVPLQAAIHIRVLDTNGRPVERRRQAPVIDPRPRIGVDPAFDGAVREGESADFAVAVFEGNGIRRAASGLTWTLSRVNLRYQWYRSEGEWDYQAIKTTERIASGTLDVSADATARISSPVQWGEYKLEVEDPDGSAIPVSMTFRAGWYVPPSADPAPDLLEVSLDKPSYKIGETVTARIHPRFPGIAIVTVLDDRLIDMKVVEVGEDGASVELPVTAEWGPGAYVTAQLIRPLDLPAKRMPQRALGLAWAGIDPGDRLIEVKMGVPSDIRPRGPLDIEVHLANAVAGEAAYVTIAAVDIGILNVTGFEPPAPEDWYFARRRLGMEIRDVYGRLIDTTIGTRGEVRSGGDGAGISRLNGPPPTEQLVAFFQGVTRVDADGKVRARFDVPDFNGTIRVMAMAWSGKAVGHGVADVLVRDPVVVMASLPNFLAPGDTTRLRLDLTHVDGAAGDMRLSVRPAGALLDVDPAFADIPLALAEKGSAEVLVPLEAAAVGDETLTVSLTLPDGEVLVKTLTVPVRANEPPIVRQSELVLDGMGGSLTLDSDLLSDFVPGTGVATVTVGTVAGIDLTGLVRGLDKYPYGCTEQITSRALPLVYLDDVILAAGLTGEVSVRDRVQKAIGDILVNQASNGGFGLWSPDYDGGDIFLNAYVTDFLTRAKEKGFDVPAVALELAVTNLKNRLAYAPDFESGGESRAYALYVLARNGRAAVGDLRYFAEAKLNAVDTPLGKAQIGAALALYGETTLAATVFQKALDQMDAPSPDRGWRADYGSRLRDGSAILTLVSESRAAGVDVDHLTEIVAKLGSASRGSYSTQEQAWMLLAAHWRSRSATAVDHHAPGAYALSTIMHRALPDVRDGLKPVHRRILHAMRCCGSIPAPLQEMRPHRRRRDGQVPPAWRPVDLRRAGAPRAGFRLALSAGRRAGQFRQHRRR